jgi:hypothetical protein
MTDDKKNQKKEREIAVKLESALKRLKEEDKKNDK